MSESERRAAFQRAMAEADSNDAADDETDDFVRPLPPSAPSQVYSVRLPVDRIEELRAVAASEGEQPSALIRQWVLEALDQRRSVRQIHTLGATVAHARFGVEIHIGPGSSSLSSILHERMLQDV